MNTAGKSNQSQRNTVAKLIAQDGDSFGIDFDALMSAADAKLISFEANGNVIILDAGRAAVEADKVKKAAKREIANKRARAFSDSMRSVGLVRTRAGGWE